MNAAAIILGRAGSRGVPGKNTASLAGRACAQWTIDDALAASSLDLVAVSTDSPELLSIARARGVRAVERPADLANDTARVDDAARHAVRALELPREDRLIVVILYANVPVRPAGLIDRAITLLRSSGADSVQSYARVGKHHPWWMARLDEGSARVRPWEGDLLNHGVFRRQDLPPAFIPDGGVLAVTLRALEGRVHGAEEGPHHFLGVDRRGIETREGDVVDIDSPIDLMIADATLRARTGGLHANR